MDERVTKHKKRDLQECIRKHAELIWFKNHACELVKLPKQE